MLEGHLQESLLQENQQLRARLEELEETLRAIRGGEVDAFVVSALEGEKIYTLNGAETPYRIMVEAMSESAITLSHDGDVLYCNGRFADLIKTPRERIVGRLLHRWITEQDSEKFASILIQGGSEVVHGELTLQAGDGTCLPAYFSMCPLPENVGKGIAAVVMDLSEIKQAERLQQNLNRALRLLSDSNMSVVRAQSEQALLSDICRLVVEVGGYLMAWIGFAGQDAERSVWPITQSGCEDGFLEGIQLSWDGTLDTGLGPTGSAIRTGATQIIRDCRSNPRMASRREASIKRGYQSSIGLPLIYEQQTFGALTVYAVEPDVFDVEEIALLEELAGNVAFGIATLRARAERIAANAENRRLSEALRQSQEAVVLTDADLRLIYVNPAFSRLFGYDAEEIIGKDLAIISPVATNAETDIAMMARVARDQGAFRGEVERRAKDGRLIPILLSVMAVCDEQGGITSYAGTMSDLTALKQAQTDVQAHLEEVTRTNEELRLLNEELTLAQSQLLQSEKMAALGILAAGVAHEINNPIGFVQSNLGTLKDYVARFLELLDAYANAESMLPSGNSDVERLRTAKDKCDLLYLRQDVMDLLKESRDGTERITRIVKDLRGFAHADALEEWNIDDIHQGIESTLNVIWNELKYKCKIKKEYGDLPRIECILAQLNQVFMNLLVNASQAIESQGWITIRTGVEGENVWVEISDTGEGVAPENLNKLFMPFFTTKPVGKGTGLGLSISYSIIQKHHGHIDVKSIISEGTTFHISLPIRQPTTS